MAARTSPDSLRDELNRRSGDSGTVREDVGHTPISAPLEGVNDRVDLVYRDIPNIDILTRWTPHQVSAALASHITGMFEMSGQLVDMIIADDRVTATLNSRMAGLFGREVRFEPADDSRAAKEVLDAWANKNWPCLTSDGAFYQIAAYQNLFGFWPAQTIYDTGGPLWTQRLDPWHARYTYYNWDIRKLVAITQDGGKAIVPGDGKWFLLAPRGQYRAWMWGTMRAIALAWLLRQYALRDMARFSEVYGAPTRIGWTPAAADPTERDRFQQQLSQLGANTTLLLPRSVDKDTGYGYELVSVGNADWQIFPGLSDRCDMHITLAILMQSLTTEVKGGSYAATESHMDIRQAGIEADNQAWRASLRNQVARPFAFVNFGDADLAPITYWDVTSRDEQASRAQKLYSVGQSVQIFRQGGVQFKNPQQFREFTLNELGVKLPEMEFVTPDNGAGSGAADAETEANAKTLKGDRSKPATPGKPGGGK